ncbi:MAG: DoxX family protein [Micromonosporaceae bacterium]|jgi:putative oxidoreductase
MDLIILIGRILFVALFLSSGVGHLRNAEAMTGYAKSRNVPAARAAVIVSGVVLLVGGLSVLLGIWPDLGALLLFLFLVPTAFLMHAFWKETDQQARMTEQIQFMKDLSLAGASLMLVGLFSQAEPGLTITGPLF